MTRSALAVATVVLFLVFTIAVRADELDNPFFAFDNGAGRGVLSPQEQAKMLKELGYQGIGYTGTGNVPAMLEALDEHGLKMYSTYVGATLGPDGGSYDPGLPEAIKHFKTHGTKLWLFVRGKGDDEQAVKLIRELADLAAEADLEVVLYPHLGFFVESVDDAIRLSQKVDRDNVGAAFNLCHWLREGKLDRLEDQLAAAIPHLKLVSINGADKEGGWDRLIRTLDQGEYDVYNVVKRIRELGYTGPIGLQCYNVKGDRRENLRKSINAWRVFQKRYAEEHE
jgi:sugar phosphate isomerase/epimerase